MAIARGRKDSEGEPKKEEEKQPVSYLEELYGAASDRSGSSSKNEGYISERSGEDMLAADSDDEKMSDTN